MVVWLLAGLLFRLGIPRRSCGDCEIFWWASQCHCLVGAKWPNWRCSHV